MASEQSSASCIRVSPNDDADVFTATVVDDLRWNGWALPWFTREEAQKIADRWPADISYDADRDVFTSTEEDDPFDWGTRDVDGTRLYGVGAGNWTWEEA